MTCLDDTKHISISNEEAMKVVRENCEKAKIAKDSPTLFDEFKELENEVTSFLENVSDEGLLRSYGAVLTFLFRESRRGIFRKKT